MSSPSTTLSSKVETSQPHRVVLYYPAKQRDGTPVTNHEGLAQALELLLCREMGGVTRYAAVGNYTTVSGTIHRENIEVLEVYCEAIKWEEQRRFLEILAGGLARTMNQESLALAVNGRLYLIPECPDWEKMRHFPPLTDLEPSEIARELRERISQIIAE